MKKNNLDYFSWGALLAALITYFISSSNPKAAYSVILIIFVILGLILGIISLRNGKTAARVIEVAVSAILTAIVSLILVYGLFIFD